MKVCSQILYTNSVVFKECWIENKLLPHGALDIVCGRLHPENFSINLSVVIDKNDESEKIGNPQFVSAKNTLESKAISKCQHQPHNYVRVTLFLSSSYRAPNSGGGTGLGRSYVESRKCPLYLSWRYCFISNYM